MGIKYDSLDILNALKHYYAESIFVTDKDGKIIFVNDVGASRLGSTLEKLEGANVKDLLAEGLYQQSSVLEAMNSKQETIANLTPNSPELNISHSVPILDESGNIYMVVTNNMNEEHSKRWSKLLSDEKETNTKLRRELDYLRLKDKRPIIANSPSMRKIISTIDAIAPTDSNIVILGESGTGKDMVSHLIHEQSSRSANAYISVNCAAIPESLLESELFGYEKGAFTGALSSGKIGLFEAAEGGTIFLDEIGDMPLPLQAKLLRALENREIRRVGGVKNIPIDVRIICATNSNLHTLVEEKKFREDLYYRLSVFEINLPPLRDRTEDIIPLAEYFLQDLNNKNGTQKFLGKISKRTMLSHKWPGNIRELRNVIERIFVVSPTDDLIFSPTPYTDVNAVSMQEMDDAQLPHFDSLKSFVAYAEQKYIHQTLEQCNGSINETAKQLGIHRSVLYRKLHK